MKKIRLSILLIISVIYFACSKTVVGVDDSLMAEGIQTLCLWQRYDDALLLYNKYFEDNQEKQGYLKNMNALSIFSNTNQKDNYFKYLSKFIKFHGEKRLVKGFTNDEFYKRNEQEIVNLFETIAKEKLSDSDSLTIVEFMFNDQEIRKNRKLTKELDSINQISIKKLIAQKKYNNIHLYKALRLLMRHVSPNYLKEFKESGLLEYYCSISMLTREEYYDAVLYTSGDLFSPEIDSIDSKRKSLGLLPKKFSPLLIKNKRIFKNYKIPSNDELNILSDELIKYIEL